ncbi:MAG: hypothetical protein WA208_18660 [Thermoanaerobaculia bacterium]
MAVQEPVERFVAERRACRTQEIGSGGTDLRLQPAQVGATAGLPLKLTGVVHECNVWRGRSIQRNPKLRKVPSRRLNCGAVPIAHELVWRGVVQYEACDKLHWEKQLRLTRSIERCESGRAGWSAVGSSASSGTLHWVNAFGYSFLSGPLPRRLF